MEFKFGIGDYVTHKAHFDLFGIERAQPMMVVARHMDECYGGIQCHYLCRPILAPIEYMRLASFQMDVAKLVEPELVALDMEEYKQKRNDKN